MNKVKPLISPRLKLRAPTPSAKDMEAFTSIVTHPLVCEYDDMSPDISRYEVKKEYLGYPCRDPLNRALKRTVNQDLSLLLIEEISEKKVVGALYVYPMSGYGCLEMGYQLHPDHFGKGYAQEALRLLIPELFRRGVYRIECRVDPGNKASVKLLDRLGFFYEGNSRGSCLVRGVRRSEFVYSLLVTDNPARAKGTH